MDDNTTRSEWREKSDEFWREHLTAEEYTILREGSTEPPFLGKYYDMDEAGVYRCAACKTPLFSSDSKYASKSGWPSFFETLKDERIELRRDTSHGMERTEVVCATCGSHLGHLFPDGPQPTGQRYCINSVALDFTPQET